jgi:penicillin-binding protein-related factor A (putative recombinase)
MSSLARSRGVAFEALLEQHFDAYRTMGICDLVKVDPPTRVVYKGRKPIVIQLENPFLDYIGTWNRRMIMMEAKTTLEPRLPFKVDSGGLTHIQCNQMMRWKASGGVVGLLWNHGDEIRLVLPAHIESAEWAKSRSIRWADAFPVERGHGFIIWDFMKTVAKFYP